MLEAKHRDGHGRILHWEPEGHRAVSTPTLILPDVPGCPRPDWAQVAVTSRPRDEGLLEIVSGGTWFQPAEHTGSDGQLVVAAPRPGPTHQVQVLDVSEELAVFHDAGGWAKDPSRLVPAWIDARTQAGGRALWAPALGTPADYALWTYLGADLFDASPLLLHAVRGEATTVDGIRTTTEMEEIHGGTWDHDELVAANLEAAHQELQVVRHALRNGMLRALVERRVHAAPASIEVLRRMDRQHTFLESAAPHHRDAPLPCMTWDALWMPEVESFRRRLRERYHRPAGADVLVLLPCSARKPYRLSRSHRRMQRVLDDSGMRHRIHEVMVTSPLGLVPRELEDTYPARAYDVPVTGEWNRDEAHIIRTQLEHVLEQGSYAHVIAHVGPGTWDVVQDLLPQAVHTAPEHPTRDADLAGLAEAIAALDGPRQDPRAGGRRRKLADIQSLLTWQFGREAALELTAESRTSGRLPYVKLSRGDTQFGQTTPERGLVSLTLDGARIVAAHATSRVHIGDFVPQRTSSLFAVGVEGADPGVRAGDEVAVVHGDEVRGCGVAQMSAQGMTHARRGVAVQLRHTGGA